VSKNVTNHSLRVAVVSTSMRPSSRSRILAEQIAVQIKSAGGHSQFIDLALTPLPMYHGGELTTEQAEIVNSINQAEAYVFCVGVYNAGVNASAHNLMHWMLDSSSPKHKPFFLGVSAGSMSSLFSTEAFSRSLMHEINAVQVVPPCFVTEDSELTGDTGLSSSIAPRIERAVRVLLAFGYASRELRASDNHIEV
jgi:NAD(P)H-dependent FMN reductase